MTADQRRMDPRVKSEEDGEWGAYATGTASVERFVGNFDLSVLRNS